MQIHATLMLTVFLGNAVAAQDNAAKDDLKKGQGSWKLASAHFNGQDSELFKDATVTVKDDRVSLILPNGAKIAWTFKLDASTNPKCVDFKNARGETTEGIYELKGDDLRICVSIKGGVPERPNEFTAKANSSRILYALKRDKP